MVLKTLNALKKAMTNKEKGEESEEQTRDIIPFFKKIGESMERKLEVLQEEINERRAREEAKDKREEERNRSMRELRVKVGEIRNIWKGWEEGWRKRG